VTRRRLSLVLLAFLLPLVAAARAAGFPVTVDVARFRPPARVHWAPGANLPDRDADGVPDAAREALTLAARVDGECRAAGLGRLPDDGDGEADLWLAAGPPPPGSIALPVDLALHDPVEFRAEAARRLAEAVLRDRAPGAPEWWTAPSACWLARRATGILPRSCGDPGLRWTHPEPGLLSTGPLLSAANLALLDALGGPGPVRAVLRATWGRLAAVPGNPVTAVEGGLAGTTGLDLAGLFLRAGIARLAAGEPPPREGLRVEALPVLEEPLGFPLGPLGGALVHVLPDPRFPEATLLELDPCGRPLRATLLLRREGGPLDLVDLAPGPDGLLRVTLPWHDYREAFLLLARPDAEPGPVEVLVHAEPGDGRPPFELASFSATATAGGTVFVEWRTGHEEGIVAWLVERSVDGGPWEAANPVPLPALGILTGGGSYVFPDDTAPAASLTRWRLVALLENGLRWTGPVVRAAP